MNLKAVVPFTTRDEENKHTAMVLEWVRCNDPIFGRKLMDYLFTPKLTANKQNCLTNLPRGYQKAERQSYIVRVTNAS